MATYSALNDLLSDLKITINTLHIPCKVLPIGNNYAPFILIPDFGTLVICLDGTNYSILLDKAHELYPGYRLVFITPEDNYTEKKHELIWQLARSGYIRHIRSSYPNQFKVLLNTQDYGRKIITERLRIWGTAPKYKYLVEENKVALVQSSSYILSVDPSFFDYMPEDPELS